MADDQRVGVYFTNPPAKKSGSLLLDLWWWMWRVGLVFAALRLLAWML